METGIAIWLYSGIRKDRDDHLVKGKASVSVVIAARNEADHLKVLLDQFKTQTYRDFEVILVDDRSSDETRHILNEYAEENWFISIRIDELPEGWNGKKHAIYRAVQKAKKDILLFTDADCLPASPRWIEFFAKAFNDNTTIVLGFSPYKNENSLLNQLIQYETLLTGLQYLGFAQRAYPYMAVGRNWAIKRSSYPLATLLEKKGLTGGDDDLIAQTVSNGKNTKVLISHESLVHSWPETSWKNHLKQKVRHSAIGLKYTPKARTISSILPLSLNISLVLFIVTLLLTQWQVSIVIYGIRSLCFYIIFRRLGQKLDSELSPMPLAWIQLCYPFWYAYVGIRSLAAKKIEWKAESSFLTKH